MIRYSIPFRLDGCNLYINACRSHRRAGAAFKKKTEGKIEKALSLQKVTPPPSYPVIITFKWKELNTRRDVDNIAFDKKFILDSLVHVGALEDDRRKFVCGFRDYFPDPVKDDVGVDIEIESLNEAIMREIA
jgi:Holliday junction resolvase RusA-like endonuclease